jgi:glycosyltransferase involved in cell wall biosynthesis
MHTENKIRVVMVAPRFPIQEVSVDGGTEGVSLFLSRALARLKEIDLHVLHPFGPPGSKGLRNVYGLRVHVLEKSGGGFRAYIKADWLRTLKLIYELTPDIVHIQSLPRWANQCPFPNVVTIHGISERDVLYENSFLASRIKFVFLRLLEGRGRRDAKHVIAISPYTHKFLGTQRKQRIWDIPNPVADEFFKVKHAPEAGRVFSACHMTPLKNARTLIEAFAPIAKIYPNAELRFAGSDQGSKYGQECRSFASAVGLENQVKFLGLLSFERIREELACAECFALCSLQENAPLSVGEAMAAGVPVVASRIGGLPWMVDNSITGRLVDPLDTNNITEGLLHVIKQSKSGEMGLASKRKAEAMFRPAIVARKTLEVYREILSNSSQLPNQGGSIFYD